MTLKKDLAQPPVSATVVPHAFYMDPLVHTLSHTSLTPDNWDKDIEDANSPAPQRPREERWSKEKRIIEIEPSLT